MRFLLLFELLYFGLSSTSPFEKKNVFYPSAVYILLWHFQFNGRRQVCSRVRWRKCHVNVKHCIEKTVLIRFEKYDSFATWEFTKLFNGIINIQIRRCDVRYCIINFSSCCILHSTVSNFIYRSRINERKISLEFLGIILRIPRLNVSVWIS